MPADPEWCYMAGGGEHVWEAGTSGRGGARAGGGGVVMLHCRGEARTVYCTDETRTLGWRVAHMMQEQGRPVMTCESWSKLGDQGIRLAAHCSDLADGFVFHTRNS
jgi:hypothetical protein